VADADPAAVVVVVVVDDCGGGRWDVLGIG
jgi:hypothetical protein